MSTEDREWGVAILATATVQWCRSDVIDSDPGDRHGNPGTFMRWFISASCQHPNHDPRQLGWWRPATVVETHELDEQVRRMLCQRNTEGDMENALSLMARTMQAVRPSPELCPTCRAASWSRTRLGTTTEHDHEARDDADDSEGGAV